VNRRAVLAGALLLCITQLSAQTDEVRLRITDSRGSVIQTAKATLLGAGNRVICTALASDVGEIVFTGLPLGDSHFIVTAPGFGVFPLWAAVRSSNGENIQVKLDVAPIEDVRDVETVQMPYAQALGLASAPQAKPAKRKRWQIFR
jgi:hypothetical protein